MKKIITFILLICLSLSLWGCDKKTEKKTVDNSQKILATVNGENVTQEEVDYFSGRIRSRIIAEYAEKYGVTDFNSFWDEEFDGVTPKDKLREEALQAAVEAKCKLSEMKQNGIYEEVSYSGLQSLAEEYNRIHKNAAGSAGVTSIDLDSFYTYYISNGEMELQNKKELSDSQYKEYIEEVIKNAEIEYH